MLLSNGVTLYHGSYTQVEKPDLSKCAPGKDFGRGFYVTTDREQAKKFTKSSIKKAQSNGFIDKEYSVGYVSVYTYIEHTKLNIHEFSDADREWLHCVVAHRRRRKYNEEVLRWGNYDVICGKIANDNTNLVITAYIDGIYGKVMSEQADRIAIGFLEPDNLKNQLCFRTDKAIGSLNYVTSEEIRL